MKVRSVIIDSLHLEFLESDLEKLTKLVEQVLKAGRNPIVLLNEKGDELLRKIPQLLECDLVYTEKSDRKFEGLLTGLHGAGTCAFYLPLDAIYGEESLWLELEKNLAQLPYMNKIHVLFHPHKGPWLITPTGTLYLKSKESSYLLEKDKDLNKLEVS